MPMSIKTSPVFVPSLRGESLYANQVPESTFDPTTPESRAAGFREIASGRRDVGAGLSTLRLYQDEHDGPPPKWAIRDVVQAYEVAAKLGMRYELAARALARQLGVVEDMLRGYLERERKRRARLRKAKRRKRR